MKVQADARGITLSHQGKGTVSAPEKDVWEVLFNLIDNAIRYGREGGWACPS